MTPVLRDDAMPHSPQHRVNAFPQHRVSTQPRHRVGAFPVTCSGTWSDGARAIVGSRGVEQAPVPPVLFPAGCGCELIGTGLVIPCSFPRAPAWHQTAARCAALLAHAAATARGYDARLCLHPRMTPVLRDDAMPHSPQHRLSALALSSLRAQPLSRHLPAPRAFASGQHRRAPPMNPRRFQAQVLSRLILGIPAPTGACSAQKRGTSEEPVPPTKASRMAHPPPSRALQPAGGFCSTGTLPPHPDRPRPTPGFCWSEPPLPRFALLRPFCGAS